MKDRNEEYEIDLLRLLKVLWSRALEIVVVGIIAASISFGYTVMMIEPTYQANAMIYVNNSSFSLGSTSFSISSSDISASQSLVETYIVILTSRNTLNEVITKADLDLSYNEIRGMISAQAVNETEIFKITVSSKDPEQAKLIANTICDVLPDKVSSIIDGSSVRIVDYAVKPSVKSSPSITKNTVIGFAVGAFLICIYFILRDLFDDVIRNEDYLTTNFEIPVLAAIPNLAGDSHGGKYYKKKYYKYGKYSKYGNYGKYGYSYGYGYGGYENSARKNNAEDIELDKNAENIARDKNAESIACDTAAVNDGKNGGNDNGR